MERTHICEEKKNGPTSKRLLVVNREEIQSITDKQNLKMYHIWSYGSQSKIVSMIAQAPWYVSNETLHQDLRIVVVNEVIKSRLTDYRRSKD